MQIIIEHLGILFFGILFLGALWFPVSWLLLSIFTPKSLLDQYFREPYFSLTETVMMKMFPGFLLRTAIFGWGLYFPNLIKKRGIVNLDQCMPYWYVLTLKLFIAGVMFSLVGMLGLMAFLMLLPKSYGPEHVLFTIPTF